MRIVKAFTDVSKCWVLIKSVTNAHFNFIDDDDDDDDNNNNNNNNNNV